MPKQLIFSLIGGLALFIYGIHLMGDEDKLPFSHKAIQEIEHVHQEVLHMIESTINALSSHDMKEAQVVLMNEIRINKLRDSLKNNHINRLNKGVCSILSGIVFLDTISNFEKIADYLTNIRQAVMDGLQWKHEPLFSS